MSDTQRVLFIKWLALDQKRLGHIPSVLSYTLFFTESMTITHSCLFFSQLKICFSYLEVMGFKSLFNDFTRI
jgi:hypothetical protein